MNYLDLPFRLLEIIFNYKWNNNYKDIKKKLLIGKNYNEYIIKLHLFYLRLEDYNFINRLTNLEYLDLSYTKISDINNLPKNLITLYLYGCHLIEDYSILDKLPHCHIHR